MMLSRKRHHSTRQSSCNAYFPSRAWHIISITSFLYLPTSQSFSTPSASFPTGEHLVQTQLSHYKASNLPAVYELCSPWFQDTTGSLSDFEQSLNNPPFNLLLNHERADVLLETIPDTPDKGESIQAACYLVCIKPGKDAPTQYPVWFWWETSRHYLNDEELDDENYEGEWKVDCVVPDFEDLEFETESLVELLNQEDGDYEEGELLSFLMDLPDEDGDEDEEEDEGDGYDYDEFPY